MSFINTSRRIASHIAVIALSSSPVWALEAPTLPVVGPVSIAIKHVVKDSPYTPAYDYAPSVMLEGDQYKVWWCGTGPQNKGDWIYYSTTKQFDGTWSVGQTPYTTVFSPTGRRGDMDGDHTCDPDVIKVGSKYYMYYGGLATPDTPNPRTEIAIASSSDGVNWSRLNSGKSIIGPLLPQNGDAYGAGQPSVVQAGSYYYMIYTTVWRPTLNGAPVGGEFAIRATDPLFRNNVEELRNSGWVRIGSNSNGTLAVNRERRLLGGDHVFNLAYLANHNVFAMVANGKIQVMDLNFNPIGGFVNIPADKAVTEQRGVTRNELGHIFLGDPQRYNVQTMVATFSGVGDSNNIFYYDMGRQTFQMQLPGGQYLNGFKICAHEGGVCRVPAAARVAYGTGTSLAYRNATGKSSIACTNERFGDPAVGHAKACFYRLQ